MPGFHQTFNSSPDYSLPNLCCSFLPLFLCSGLTGLKYISPFSPKSHPLLRFRLYVTLGKEPSSTTEPEMTPSLTKFLENFVSVIYESVFLFCILNLWGWCWLRKSQVSILKHIICVLHCVFTTQSAISFRHPRLDTLCPLLPPLPHLLSGNHSTIYCLCFYLLVVFSLVSHT